ncbi:hypothetical protein [Escherichia coli]|uniref:hypothetical protein n=1 Tax=Escherichia coli TaxID=562 RepID=UPI00259D07DA|nr:hypothetical protein [Escherichia coli]MDM4883101.1 hypothetical protein [Escherichia coli]
MTGAVTVIATFTTFRLLTRMTIPFGQVTAVHREEGLSQTTHTHRGQLTAVKDTQGHETRMNTTPPVTYHLIAPTQQKRDTVHAWGKAICTTQAVYAQYGNDAAGRVIRLTSENGSHTTFRYDVLTG